MWVVCCRCVVRVCTLLQVSWRPDARCPPFLLSIEFLSVYWLGVYMWCVSASHSTLVRGREQRLGVGSLLPCCIWTGMGRTLRRPQPWGTCLHRWAVMWSYPWHFFRHTLSRDQKLAIFAGLAGQQAPGLCLPSPPLACWGSRSAWLPPAFMWLLGAPTQVLLLTQQVLLPTEPDAQTLMIHLKLPYVIVSLHSEQLDSWRCWDLPVS